MTKVWTSYRPAIYKPAQGHVRRLGYKQTETLSSSLCNATSRFNYHCL